MSTGCKWGAAVLVVWGFLLARDLWAQESAFSNGDTAAAADTAAVVSAGGASDPVQKVSAEIYCPIVSFEPQEDGTLLATIARGRDDGLVGGTRGEVYSRRDKETDRKVILIGQGELVGLEADSAMVRIHPTHEDTLYAIAAGDVVALSARIPRLKYPTVLFDLARQDISFTDRRKKPYFQYRDFIAHPGRDFETELLPLIAKGVARAAYRIGKFEKGKTPAKSGRFVGLTAKEAMEQTTADDVRAFFQFAHYNPAAYIGNPCRFVEGYAAWVIHQTPISPGEVREHALAIEDRDERKAYLRGIADMFAGDYPFEANLEDYIERWYSEVLRLSNGAEFEKAHQLADLMLIAADVVDQAFSRSLAYSALGYLLSDEKL